VPGFETREHGGRADVVEVGDSVKVWVKVGDGNDDGWGGWLVLFSWSLRLQALFILHCSLMLPFSFTRVASLAMLVALMVLDFLRFFALFVPLALLTLFVSSCPRSASPYR
jgi:hypothetical protein